MEPVIPPRQDAKIKRHGNSKRPRLERDEAIRDIRQYGCKGWKRRIGYHRCSRAETAMFRMQYFYVRGACFGTHLKNRLLPNQKNGSENKAQNTQPLYKTRTVAIFFKGTLGNNADRAQRGILWDSPSGLAQKMNRGRRAKTCWHDRYG
jgi:hypothetical protein